MAQLPQPFDANQHEPTGSFDPIPPSWYIGMITESEMKPTKARDGYYLQITLQVLDGPHKGRIVWDRLNLMNKNQTAVDIAQRTLSAICHSIGKLSIADSVELHNQPLQFKAKVRPANGQFSASNEVEAYRKADGTELKANGAPAQAPAPAPAQATQAPAPAADSTPPWMR